MRLMTWLVPGLFHLLIRAVGKQHILPAVITIISFFVSPGVYTFRMDRSDHPAILSSLHEPDVSEGNV